MAVGLASCLTALTWIMRRENVLALSTAEMNMVRQKWYETMW